MERETQKNRETERGRQQREIQRDGEKKTHGTAIKRYWADKEIPIHKRNYKKPER